MGGCGKAGRRRALRLFLAIAALVASIAPALAATDTPGPLVRLRFLKKMTRPVGMATRNGDANVYIIEQGGKVRILSTGATVLDLTGQVSTASENGLLGIAFNPAGNKLYVDFTDTNEDTHVREYAFAGGVVDTSTAREVLFVDQPFTSHKAGHLAFGPDGRLYIALGDGGHLDDPNNNGQNLGTLLGKILRINPTPAGSQPYQIPNTNPFRTVAGARPEIWVYGLRNPWRFSFDKTAKDLWIGDPGQDLVEEINFQVAGSPGGENYGWDRLEGTFPHEGTPPVPTAPPVHQYTHVDGACSVIGGYVYRGTKIPALQGMYVYGDFCTGRIHAFVSGAGKAGLPIDIGGPVPYLTSFGQDKAGELYVMNLSGSIYKLEAARV